MLSDHTGADATATNNDDFTDNDYTCHPAKLDDYTAARLVPERSSSAHKGQNGRVLVVGGSYLYHGAPILASLAAMRFGADLVYTGVPRHNATATRAASPDLIVIPMADAKLTRGSASKLLGIIPAGMDAAAIGMGLAVHERGALKKMIRSLAESDVRLVLDAAALVPDILDDISGTNSVLTPHAGEFEHLFGRRAPPESEPESRMRAVLEQARIHNVTVLLKGITDIISDGKNTYTCRAGAPGMTVGGTGDVLAGLVAGALAACRRPLDAAALAAYANGRAGELVAARQGSRMIASDLIDEIPIVLRGLDDYKCPRANRCDDNDDDAGSAYGGGTQ